MSRVIAALLIALAASPVLALDPALREKARHPDSFKRSDAARALGKDGSPDAAKILLTLLEDRNPYVRDYTVEACGRLTDEKAVGVLAARIGNKDPLFRRNLADALGRTGSPAALSALKTLALRDRDPAVRAQALDGLWRYRENADALAIADSALSDKAPFVRAAAAEAAGRIKGEGALEVVQRALGDEDEGVRCVALMELRYLDRELAARGLAAAAGAPGWRTRAQVVDDALAIRDVLALDALVKLVADECLRVACAAHRALKLLSGTEIGRDADLWEIWWKANREEWKAPKGTLRELAEGEDGGSRARFHGIEVTSDRVVFVIDISGSMREKLAGDEKGRTRWEAVRDELAATFKALPDGTMVNLVLFGERIAAALPAPAPLSKRVRSKIMSFAKRATPGERGNLLGGMQMAFGQPGTDTVFLLSDGAPSAGEMVVKDRVRRAIRQSIRMLKMRIHAVGFGSEKKSERRFMEGLAEDSGGEVTFR